MSDSLDTDAILYGDSSRAKEEPKPDAPSDKEIREADHIHINFDDGISNSSVMDWLMGDLAERQKPRLSDLTIQRLDPGLPHPNCR